MRETEEQPEVYQPLPEDASQYLAMMKRAAIDVLSPQGDNVKWDHITRYSGKFPNAYGMYLAFCEWEIEGAMEGRRKIRWEILDPVKFLRENVPSIGGWRSNQIVEIARASPVEHRHSLLDILRGR